MRIKSTSVQRASAVLALVSVIACETGAKNAKIFSPLPDSTVIMKYDGGTVTAKELNEFIKPQLSQFEEQALDAYKQGAERVLLRKLVEAEAKKQNMPSADALMNQVTTNATVSDEKVKEFFKQNNLDKGIKDPRTGKNRKVSMDEIKNYLMNEERRNAQQNFLQGLMAKANAQTVLEEPRVNVKLNGGEPTLGGANAKIVINEFSDFQCPYCSRAAPTVHELNKIYGDKIKIVFRQMPIEGHPQARPSAIASLCAHRQGKFWEMHDKLFAAQGAMREENFGEANFLAMGKELGLDMAKFEACVKNGETAADVKKDEDVAQELGVNSTPTFFVNGKKVAGAMPVAQFKTLIDAELNKK